ncbi:putative transcriptional regulator YwtF [Streptomyces sp. YIM 130001]|uniref:LCP family protein n=1 Tax=Streptomyces sp. YIM 130001 TaxID=2259644 RepID=UPI000E653ABD|nr:LCP family protein [Streptomyces sp. YIM 130001]RII12421.1 putative transcriptional regulator YwtF [Streptomyces sp. YIM 130001]
MLWTAGVFSVLILAVAGVGAWVYQDLDGSIGAADIDGKVGGDRPEKLSPGSKNILVVGSDSRDGDNGKYGKGLTTMQSDTLMVVHIAADRKWATVVSFPRDSWVEVPACDKGDGTRSAAHHFKINEAFAIGGATGEVAGAAACTIRAVEQNTGLRIDHFTSVDFQGFKGMVNALGGIEVCPKQAIHDKKADLDLEAGCQTVKDEAALGYVRTRYSVGDGSDISRIERQQEFMRALADRAKQKLTSPGDLYGFLKAATGSITTDRSLAGVRPLAGLATELKGVPEDRLTFLTVPNYPRELDVPTDRANVVWQYPQAAQLFTSLAKDKEVDKKRVAGDAANGPHARDVRVQVLNGTDRGGLAGKAAEELKQAGYTVTGTGNAPDTEEKTRVTYPSDQRAQAQVLRSRLPGAKAEASDEATAGAVTLVVGEDFTSLR